MANRSSAIVEVTGDDSPVPHRGSMKSLKLKSYGIFSEGICSIPDSELQISDLEVAELVRGLLLQRTASAKTKQDAKDLEDAMPLEWCRRN
mmetsp:Transcript_67916/g.119899  ORF Transcript_67916/g.119899 Transcript_67916/m.119899 type:complete len:91 (-) Transcript_67916:202-474(-)|eukprot:CAMPEP_0197642290 /NCGR_PEP_ID=MMETSP1338-20131121/15992_1 /TAXON_ID=43686 ORGANISM="Pelagodinium beii, Strain RCC1491" /NCGR_SAMPLE_ID=MMETSP1338 /ASSEMBLY_ACC=CAM_ASM_000754 /LENGTH=90 /DNA_ID=CAMNT_0043215387 /DNA_START=23 /DNA_END=295 /DNA_ORIENTATION=+